MYPVTYVNVYAVDAGDSHLWLYRRLHDGIHHRRRAGLRHRLLLSALCRAGRDPGLLPVSVLLCRRRLVQSVRPVPGRAAAAVYGPYGGAARRQLPTTPTPAPGRVAARSMGPYGGAGAWSAYNPATGRYAHGSASWGPYGGTAQRQLLQSAHRRVRQHDAERQRLLALGLQHDQRTEPDGQHRQRAATHAARPAAFSSTTGAGAAGIHTDTGNNAAVGKTASGNVYAGADGNAYKHTDSGWSKWNNGSWQPVQPPASQRSQQTPAAVPGQRERRRRPRGRRSAPAAISSSNRTASRGSREARKDGSSPRPRVVHSAAVVAGSGGEAGRLHYSLIGSSLSRRSRAQPRTVMAKTIRPTLPASRLPIRLTIRYR